MSVTLALPSSHGGPPPPIARPSKTTSLTAERVAEADADKACAHPSEGHYNYLIKSLPKNTERNQE